MRRRVGDSGDEEIVKQHAGEMTSLAPVVIEGHGHITTELGVLNKVLEPREVPANYHNVAVNNSTVHLGNKTYIDHVTIKQFISSSDSGETSATSVPRAAAAPSELSHQDEKPWAWKGVEKVQERWGLSTRQCVCGAAVCATVLVAVVALAAGLLSPYSKQGQEAIEALHGNVPIETDIGNVLLTPSTLRLISRKEWLAQPPSGGLDALNLPVPAVVITHTATENCTDQASCTFHVRYMQTFHMESQNWNDIGYNFLVGGDGAVYEGRGWDKVGAHTRGYNTRCLGIAFIGTFNDIRPPERQLVAAQLLLSVGVSLGKISKDYKLFGHRQLIPTLSPGNMLFAEIQKWPHFARDFSDTSKSSSTQ